MWCSRWSERWWFLSCMSPHSCVCVFLGVSVCSRCVTYSVPYSNTFIEARKQLSVPFVKYRKHVNTWRMGCTPLRSGCFCWNWCMKERLGLALCVSQLRVCYQLSCIQRIILCKVFECVWNSWYSMRGGWVLVIPNELWCFHENAMWVWGLEKSNC